MTLHELSVQARALAADVFEHGPPCRNCKPSCIENEERRPLTQREINFQWSRRPWHAYDPLRMCNACEAYWHVELAAQALHRLDCLTIRENAQKETAT